MELRCGRAHKHRHKKGLWDPTCGKCRPGQVTRDSGVAGLRQHAACTVEQTQARKAPRLGHSRRGRATRLISGLGRHVESTTAVHPSPPLWLTGFFVDPHGSVVMLCPAVGEPGDKNELLRSHVNVDRGWEDRACNFGVGRAFSEAAAAEEDLGLKMWSVPSLLRYGP
jgi:hypothetical protein